ncbi:MAG: hypothetical protein ACC661_09730, partial [Verrucomicrobiales bacterium]
TFTLGFGNDGVLSGLAVRRAMEILVADPELEDDENKIREMHALALLYKNSYGKGSVPAAFMDYVRPYVAPVAPDAVAPPAPPAPPADAGDAAEGTKEEKPADSTDSAPPAKGEAGDAPDPEAAQESDAPADAAATR